MGKPSKEASQTSSIVSSIERKIKRRSYGSKRRSFINGKEDMGMLAKYLLNCCLSSILTKMDALFSNSLIMENT
jgi:hypothetical protein